jgi:hypothetical protein
MMVVNLIIRFWRAINREQASEAEISAETKMHWPLKHAKDRLPIGSASRFRMLMMRFLAQASR